VGNPFGHELMTETGIGMASKTRSMLSTIRIFANCSVLGSCLVLAAPSWAARDAGQMIAQDKANQDVIARRQAAIDEAQAASHPAGGVLDHGARATTTPWPNAQRRLPATEPAASSTAVGAATPPAAPAMK